MTRQEIIDSIEDPVEKQLEQDIYDVQKKWDYDTMDATMVLSNRILGWIAAYQRAYPDVDFSEAIAKSQEELKARMV
jgi:hypothetical protein